MSPRINLLAIIFFGVAVLVAGAGYVQYDFSATTLRAHFVASLEADRNLRSSAATGIYHEWEHKIVDIGGIVAALSDVRQAAAHSDIGLASRALAEYFMAVGIASGAGQLQLLDANLKTLGAWGIPQTGAGSESLARKAIQSAHPQERVDCGTHGCFHTTAVPVFDETRVVGVLLLVADVRDFAVMFTAITNYRIEIVPAVPNAVPALPILPEDGRPVRVQLAPVTADWPTSYAIFTTLDSAAAATALSRLRTRMAIMNVILFGLLAGLLFATLWYSLRRVNSITRAMRAIGVSNAFKSPLELAAFRRSLPASIHRWWHDDIDDLTAGLAAMCKQLEGAHGKLIESYCLLQEQLAYSEDLMESVTLPVLTLNSSGLITDFNVAFARFFGVTRDDILRRPLDALASDHSALGAMLRSATWIRPQAFREPRELRFSPPTGPARHCILAVGPYTRQDGSVVGYILTITDLTLLRRAEERFSAVARHLPGALFQFSVIAGQWRIVFASDGIAAFTGFPPNVFYDDFGVFLSHVHLEDQNAFVDSVRRATANTENWSLGFRITHQDGTVRWVRGSSSVHKTSTSDPVWTGILLDVTPERLAQAAADSALANQAEAETAVANKDGYIGMLSHELRNSLQVVIGYAAFLQRKGADAGNLGLPDDLHSLKLAAADLFDIVRDLLDLQRLAAGVHIPLEPVLLSTVFSELTQLTRLLATRRQNRVTVTLDPALQETVIQSHAHFMRRILMNLLTNACKYTNNGVINVTVSAPREEQLIIEVSDTGAGMPQAELDRLFCPFHQAGTSRDRRSGGTGLGLVIVRRLTEYLGGTVRIQSEVDQGTTVTIALPFTPATIRLPVVAQSARPFLPTPLPRLRVLIVDDDVLIRDILSRLLRPHVARIDVADNALNGLQRLRVNRYDLVLTDLNMPGLSGLDMIGQYRAEAVADWRLPFLLLTGDTDFGRCDTTLPAYSACIHKPVDERALLCAIRHLVFGEPISVEESRGASGRESVGHSILLTPPPVLDQALMLAHFDGDRSKAAVRLLEFRADIVSLLEVGISQPPVEFSAHMRRIAHLLTGTGGSVGATRMARFAEELLRQTPEAVFSQRDRVVADLNAELALFETAVLALVRDAKPIQETP